MDAINRTDGIPIVEAAAMLGTTPDAIRKRVARGRIPGYKQGGQWYAVVPVGVGQTDRADSQATVTPDILTAPLVDALRDEVDYLRAQVTEKDKQLADRTREIQELHVILQTAQQNERRLLSAGASVEMSKPPSAAPERPYEDDPPPQNASVVPGASQREREASQHDPPRRSWLARLFGWE